MQAQGVTVDALLAALREQHLAVDDCNDRLETVRGEAASAGDE